jgi:hypothetical protein
MRARALTAFVFTMAVPPVPSVYVRAGDVDVMLLRTFVKEQSIFERILAPKHLVGVPPLWVKKPNLSGRSHGFQ